MNLFRTKKAILIVAALAVTVIVVIYGTLNPAETPFPRCPFLLLTGWQCPGCGSQRAIHALLHGNLLQAWNYNAALVCSIPLLSLMVFAALNRERLCRLYNILNSSTACLVWLVSLIGWAIFRNLTN